MKRMRYYKVYDSLNKFLSVATSLNMRKYQDKHKLFLCCDEEFAQFIQIGDRLYHAQGLLDIPKKLHGKIAEVTLKEVTEEEYRKIYGEKTMITAS